MHASHAKANDNHTAHTVTAVLLEDLERLSRFSKENFHLFSSLWLCTFCNQSMCFSVEEVNVDFGQSSLAEPAYKIARRTTILFNTSTTKMQTTNRC